MHGNGGSTCSAIVHMYYTHQCVQIDFHCPGKLRKMRTGPSLSVRQDNASLPWLLSAGLSKAKPRGNAACGAIEVKTPEVGTAMVPMEGGAEKEYLQWLPVQSNEAGMH